jgi:hypothetical protein
MVDCALYTLSATLREGILAIVGAVSAALNEPVRLAEVITLPDYGQRVILRFDLEGDERLTQAEADALETRLRAAVGPHYWAALTRDVYANPLGDPSRRLTEIGVAAPEMPELPPSPHTERLREDARRIRMHLDLPDTCLVWEIEVDMAGAGAPVVLRIVDTNDVGVGPASRDLVQGATFCSIACEVTLLKQNPAFVGCVRAYLEAERRGLALANVVDEG